MRTQLHIKENYLNNNQLQNVLLFLLLESISSINDLSTVVPSLNKGENHGL